MISRIVKKKKRSKKNVAINLINIFSALFLCLLFHSILIKGCRKEIHHSRQVSRSVILPRVLFSSLCCASPWVAPSQPSILLSAQPGCDFSAPRVQGQPPSSAICKAAHPQLSVPDNPAGLWIWNERNDYLAVREFTADFLSFNASWSWPICMELDLVSKTKQK